MFSELGNDARQQSGEAGLHGHSGLLYACTQGQTLVHTCKIAEVRARQCRMRV